MIISPEITDVSPFFRLERTGNVVAMTIASSAYGWYDEDLGYWMWDGEIEAYLGEQSYYYYQTADRPLDAYLVETLTPGLATSGSFIINYGQYDESFNVTIYDTAAVFDGTAGRDFVFGSAFDDRLSGGAGNDGFEGGAGDDVINGGAGADLIDGGDGNDTASYAGASAGVEAHLGRSHLNRGDAWGDRYISIENLTGSNFADQLQGDGGANKLVGGGGGDFLFGLGGDDTLNGGAGADALFGGAGNDLLVGGAGGDVLDGGAGRDTASYATAAAGVSVSLVFGALNTGDAAGDVLINVENLIGTRYDDRLTGDAKANDISGGAGNDTIRGGGGADMLSGGKGLDTFIFNKLAPTPESAATILDYNVADDRIVLDDIAFTALSRGRLDASAFVIGSAATTADHRIIYNSATGEVSYDADGSGAGAAQVFLKLAAGLAMTELEFAVI